MDTMIDFWRRFDIQAKTLSLSKKEVAAMVGISYNSFVNYAAKDSGPSGVTPVQVRVLFWAQ
jgi:hypothetical protein